jgi:uncharacterized heparinase superfamily protein
MDQSFARRYSMMRRKPGRDLVGGGDGFAGHHHAAQKGAGVEGGRDRWRLYGLAFSEGLAALRAALSRLRHWPRLIVASAPERLLLAPQDLRTSDPTVANDVYAGLFVFAGRALTTGGRSPFQFRPPSRGWGQGLYGFGWLRHLRAANTALARANARALVNEFLVARPGSKIADETQVLARRLISFLSQSPLLLEGADHEFYRRFMRALGRNIRLLERDLDTAVNPQARLLAAIALCYAGLSCEGYDGLLRKATRCLSRELDRQILPDGGHISRNPRLLIELLLDLLPLRQIYVSRGAELPKALVGAIDRMLPMLRLFRHHDGTLAHVNGMGLTPADLLATILIYDDVRAQPMRHAPHSGYERLQVGTAVVIADVGAAPPVRQSMEAHAGCLAFEFSSGTQRIVVNCGTSRGAHETASLAGRATAAHSTATVAESSSCRFVVPPGAPTQGWIAAWLERRLGPVVLQGPTSVVARRNDAAEAIELTASHDGYQPRFGILHERRWRLSAGGDVLEGEDVFTSERGAASAVAVRFHLHPSARASQAQADGPVQVVLANQETWRFEASAAASRIEESIFFATTDRPRRTEQIVLAITATGKASVRWRFERLRNASGRDDGDAPRRQPQGS